MKIVQILLSMDKDFSVLIKNFSRPRKLDESLRKLYSYDMEKVAKTTDAVDLVEKLKNVVENRMENEKYNDALNLVCENFLGSKNKDHQFDMQKILTILFQTIEEGLAARSKKDAEKFHKIFFGKVNNEFIRETSHGTDTYKREGELEPLTLHKFKKGVEASLDYAFDLAKGCLEGKRSEKLDKIVWIIEPPKILTLVFSDEKLEDFECVGQNEIFELPNEVILEQYYEEKSDKVNKFLKKQREESKSQNLKIQKEIEETKKGT